MDTIKKGFANCLRDIRKNKKITQEQLAESIGINIRQLARIEAGKSFVTAETLYRICCILEVSPATLFSFNLSEECIKNGTNNILYINKNTYTETTQALNITQTPKQMLSDVQIFDIAKQLGKDIVVEELKSGEVDTVKLYSSNGKLQIENKVPENKLYIDLKNKIAEIANDNKKLSFMLLAFDALTDSNALTKLKIMFQGIELTQ